MPDVVRAVADSPWVLVVVFLVAGLDALLPLMPSESTVVAVAVVAAGTGHPSPVVLILVAAAGAYLGDRLAYGFGRAAPARLSPASSAAAARGPCTPGCIGCCTAVAAW
jgi:membrane-associated protein